MIKNIKKKIILFFLIVLSIFGLNSIISTSKIDKTVNAAGSNINQWVSIAGTNVKIKVCYTEDLFVAEDYSNCITSVPTSGEFYMTAFVDIGTSLSSMQLVWDLNSTEVESTTSILGIDVTNDGDALWDNTTLGDKSDNVTGSISNPRRKPFSKLPSLPGRTTGSNYIEGNAENYLYTTGVTEPDPTISNSELFYGPGQTTGDISSGIYAIFKIRIKLNSGVTTFSSTCISMRVAETTGGTVYGDSPSDFNASLGGAALSDNVDTTVTATNDSTTKNASLTESNTTANFNFDATASTSTTFKVKVDNGKGSIDTSTISSSSSGITLDSPTPTSDGYSFTCSNTQRGIFSTVSFKVISESKNNSKTYTINVQRMPIITGMTFTSNGGFANPIITTSSSSSTTGVVSSFNELPKGTYYVWGSASLQSFNVNYTCDAKSSSYNINNGGNQTGNTFTVNAQNFTISLGYDGSNNATEDYVFNYMTIADNVGLKNVTGTVAGSSTTATVTSTSATEYKVIFPYKDANGYVITSANINATLTTPSLSSVEYSFNQSNWTSGSVAPVSFASGNTTTVYFKVKDNSTSATKIYTVNVERTVRDNTDASVTVTNGTSQTGTLNSSTLSLNFTFPATASSSTTIKIKVDAGNGEISNLSSNVTNNGVNNGEYTLVLNSSVRGKYDVVTFDAVAQNGTTTKSYTINIQRLPIITDIQFTKVGSTGVNPILTFGSSSQTDSVVTIPSTGLPKGNYYVWIPTGVTKFNVSFTADALSALFNGSTYNDPVSVASTTINANTFTINLNSSDANKTEVYTFTVKTMVDHTSLKTVSGRVTNASNIGQLSGNASTGFKLTFPYSDSNGKAITSVDVTPTATDPTLSTVYYSTDGGANWTQVPTVGYFPVSINTSTNNASVKIKVEDNSSHNSKEYDVTIERTVSHEVGTVVAISGATPSTATLSATTTSTNFSLPATASSSTTINVTVDSGKGKIDLSTISGATYSSLSNGTYSLILDPTNRGSFSTVTFTVIAQDGSTSQAYTVNVQRKPIITNITFTKDDGLVDPIITKGSANSSSNPVTNFVDLAEGTYYLWVSPNVAHYLVNYTADCVSSTYNGTAYANTTVQIGTTDLIIVLLSSDSNVKATYKFVYKTITANTGLNDPTTSVTGTSTTGTLDSSTLNSDNGKDYVVKVPYLDSFGNTITSVSVKAPLTTPSSSTLEYYDASTGTWNTITSSTGTPVAIDGTTNQGSIKYRVTDKVTHDFAIYNVTVEREAADTDNSIASVTVYDVTNNNVVRAGTWTGDTYTINSNLPYNSAILRFVVTATSQHAKLTIETQTYGNTASHTHNITTKNQAVKVKITVTPQSGQTAEYYIEYYVADTRSTDRTLNQFEVSDGSNILTPTSGIFTPGTAAPLTLTYDIPYSVNSLTVTANATALGAKVYGAKSTTTSKIVNITMSTFTTSSPSKTYNYYVYSEDEKWSDAYTIVINRLPANGSVGLDNITSTDPDVVISDIPGTDNKLIEAKPGTTDVPINVTPADPNATVTITTPNGSNLTFTPNGTDSSQGIVSGLKPGNNEVTITITAPNGDDSTYTTNIWVDENPDLDNIEVYDATDTSKSYGLNPIYQQSTFNYVVNVPYSVNSTILKYAISNTIDTSKLNIRYYLGSSSISNTFNSALEAVINTTNDITVKLVVSQNYSNATPANPLAAGTRTYTIEFKKALPGTDRDLLSISANGDPVPDNGNTPYAPGEYVLEYGRNQSYVDLTNITYNGKSITVTSTDTTLTALTNDNSSYRVMLSAGKAVTVTVMVNAEDATVAPNIYKFVLVAANKDKDVANLELFENNQTYVDINNNSLVFNANTPQYPFTAKNSTNVLTLRITKPQYSTVEIGGVAKNDSYGQTTYDYTIDLSNTVSPNKYTVDVRLLSEYYVAYGQNQADASDAYKIEIERQALDNDATLSKLVVTIDGVAQTIFATRTPEGTFNIPNVGNATSINVEATPTKSTTKINGSSSNPYTNSFTLGGNTSNGYNYQIVLSCVAEDGTPQNYVLEISRGPINASDDNGIILIEVLDSNNAYYIAQQGNAANNVQQFDQTQLPYTITMPYGAKSYTINAQILQGSYAKLYITDGTGSNDVQTASRQFQIASTMYGTTITHKVYAISDSGIKGLEYTITIKFEEPNVDNSLKSLTVDGDEQITSTTPNNPTFTISRPNSVTTVDIAAIVSDPTATIASNSHLGRLSLVEGQNVFNVTVIAQNGDQQTYTIIVNRDYANPTLMDLGVTGEALLDYDTKKVTTFEPNTTKYFVRVPYTKETADIYAYSSSVSDVILGTGTKNLLVGDNKFTVKITSVHGTTTEYELHIYRLPEETMNASLDWLKVFQVGADKSNLMDGSDRLELKDENAKKISDVFNSDKIYYGVYNVNGKVGLLDVKYDTVVHGNEFYDSPVVTVLGADNLHIGKNQVVILVTAPDGIHQKAYVIEVERDDIAYNVLEDQIESDGYTLEKVVDKLEYNINIGKKKTSEVDFLLYIEALNATGDNAEQELEITYKTNIENNPDDVIIEIATKDGITKQVIFHVESTSNHNNADFWTFFPLIILLVIVLIILIMILISVNKDKYGKITRKADKKSDKKEKAANK